MSDSLGGTTSYGWDAEDRLETLTAPWATAYSFAYDGKGRRTGLTSTTGRATSYGYTNGLLTALTHAQSGVTLTDLAYTYGPDGQLTAILDNLDPTKSKAISYDALNRLVQVAEGTPVAQGGVPIPVEDYAYDGEGNRTASHLSLAHLANDHNQLLEDDTYTYAYDSKGNRVSRTAKSGGAVETYAYDSQNRLIGYSSPTTTATYAYDALDRRVAKTVDGVTEAWVYDSADLSDSTASNTALTFRAGALIKRWLFGPQVDEPLAYETYAGTTASGSGSVIELLANRLGSIITAISVSTGAVAAEYDYDSFGTRSETAALDQPYGFTGREHDAESGLMHYRARAYDPVAGVFLQVDPAEFASGAQNLNSYVDQDPKNNTDPDGLVRRKKRASVGKMSLAEEIFIEEAQSFAREAAVSAVAEGIFGLTGYIVGALGYSGAYVDAVSNAVQQAAQGGSDNLHHCFPQYMSGDAKTGPLKKIGRKKHELGHKMMQEYTRVYNLSYSRVRGGKMIRGRVSQAFLRKISRDFYDDMHQYFKFDFGC